jgi:hypothetical protein
MRHLLIIICTLFSFAASSQVENKIPEYIFNGRLGAGRVGAGDTTAYLHVGPNGGAKKGIKLPMVTDTAAVAGLKKNGLTIFSVQLNQPVYWDSIIGRWKQMGGSLSHAPGTGDTLLFTAGNYMRLVAEEFGVITNQYTNEVGFGVDTANIPTRYTIDSLGQIIVGEFPVIDIYEGLPGADDTLLFWRNDSVLIIRTPVPGSYLMSEAGTDTSWKWGIDTSSLFPDIRQMIVDVGVGSNMANSDLTLDADRNHDLAGFDYYLLDGTSGTGILIGVDPGIEYVVFGATKVGGGTAAFNLEADASHAANDIQAIWGGADIHFQASASATSSLLDYSFLGPVPYVKFYHSSADPDSVGLIFPLSGTTNTGAWVLAHDTTTGQIVRIPNGGSGSNFANADLTFTGNRLHELDGNTLSLISAGQDVLYIESDVVNGGSTGVYNYLIAGASTSQLNLNTSPTNAEVNWLTIFQTQTHVSHYNEADAAGARSRTIFGGIPSVVFEHEQIADSTRFIFPLSGTTNTGAWALAHDTTTGQLVRIPMSGGGGSGVTTMTAIGASPNANGATISTTNLTLQPADGSFGGVVTTASQTFAGTKTFTSNVRIPYSSFNTYATTTEIVGIESTNGAIAKLKRGALSQTIYEQEAKTTTYSVIEDDASVFTGDATGGTFDFDLLSAVGITGRTYTFKKIDATTNDVVIDGNTSETIDGALTYVLDEQYDFVTITSDGTNWIVTNSSSVGRSVGEEIERDFGSSILYTTLNRQRSEVTGTSNMTDGQARFSIVKINAPTTITGFKWYQSVTGNYTSDNYNGVGLYTINTSTGALTLVASSTDDGNIWKGTVNTIQTKAFSSTYAAQPGYYAVMVLYNSSAQVTAPALGIYTANGNAAIAGDGFANSLKINGFRNSRTALDGAPASSDYGNFGSNFFGGLY